MSHGIPKHRQLPNKEAGLFKEVLVSRLRELADRLSSHSIAIVEYS